MPPSRGSGLFAFLEELRERCILGAVEDSTFGPERSQEFWNFVLNVTLRCSQLPFVVAIIVLALIVMTA